MKIKKHLLLEKQYNLNFLHKKYGKVILSYGVNPLNNSWMWWFDLSPSMYHGNKNDINSIVKNIKKREKVIKEFEL